MKNKPKSERIVPVTIDKIKDGDRIKRKDYRHDFAIEALEREINNLQMELDTKKRRIKEILLEPTLAQGNIAVMGSKLRLLEIYIKRMERSVRLLKKHNVELKMDRYRLANSSKKIK